MASKIPKPAVLLILDGWGVAPKGDGNPLEAAKTPVMDELVTKYPAMTLRASAESVGLAWGEMGNSEVGHLTIGAGRVFYQSYPRITLAIQSGEFMKNDAFVSAAEHAKKNKSALHIIGIDSPGNVHGSDTHIIALLEFAKKHKIKKVFVHAILDGRDTIYNTGATFVEELQMSMKKMRVGEIASVSGRYYAMDRDNRWDRIETAYNAMTGQGEMVDDALDAIAASYSKNIFDEEFSPVTVAKKDKAIGAIEDGDAVVFANFRPDRAVQLTKAFTVPDFNKFKRKQLSDLFFVTMTEYEKDLPVTIAFPPEIIETCLAKVISDAGLKQLHIAETEKYAHVTFFINGMREAAFPGEDRIIIPSPKVASYDKEPEMSAGKITDKIISEIKKDKYDVVIANFANADMVGHTGAFKATKEAVEYVDKCVGKIVSLVEEIGGVVLITADHGNAEEVKNLQTGDLDKEHSTNPVPFIIIGEAWRGKESPGGAVPEGDLSLLQPIGVLADVAPTMLGILNIPSPTEMNGSSLV